MKPCSFTSGQENPDSATGRQSGNPYTRPTSYVFKDSAQGGWKIRSLPRVENIYTRLMNPTSDVFEKRIAALEGGRSGTCPRLQVRRQSPTQSKILQNPEDHIVLFCEYLRGVHTTSLQTLFTEWGIETTFVDGSDPKKLREGN